MKQQLFRKRHNIMLNNHKLLLTKIQIDGVRIIKLMLSIF